MTYVWLIVAGSLSRQVFGPYESAELAMASWKGTWVQRSDTEWEIERDMPHFFFFLKRYPVLTEGFADEADWIVP